MDMIYKTRESDYDKEKAEEMYGNKSAEELEKEWQEMKKYFPKSLKKFEEILGGVVL